MTDPAARDSQTQPAAAAPAPGSVASGPRDWAPPFGHRHLLRIEELKFWEAEELLDRAKGFATLNQAPVKKLDTLRGRTVVNMFFENSTRTQSSFEMAAKRLGADVVNMQMKSSSLAKGETLLDTVATLNAMRPEILVVRHGSSGAVELLAAKINCSVVNAGDGQHEHPSQALLDAYTIREAFGRIEGLTIAICGDVLHSRVARSNVALLNLLGAQVRLIGPPTLMPRTAGQWGATIYHDMKAGLKDVDVVMMLRLQLERMQGSFVPSTREYFWFYGLDAEKLALASPHVRVMHPGPMNRGVEIDSVVADDPQRSLINDQVANGVAVRMAILDVLAATQQGQA